MPKEPRPWSLLSSQGIALVTIHRHPGLTVVELADKTGLSRRSLMRALADLESAGMLKREHRGRRTLYQTKGARLRHQVLRDKRVGDLLQVFPPAG